jgi:hypothetical protein
MAKKYINISATTDIGFCIQYIGVLQGTSLQKRRPKNRPKRNNRKRRKVKLQKPEKLRNYPK